MFMCTWFGSEKQMFSWISQLVHLFEIILQCTCSRKISKLVLTIHAYHGAYTHRLAQLICILRTAQNWCQKYKKRYRKIQCGISVLPQITTCCINTTRTSNVRLLQTHWHPSHYIAFWIHAVQLLHKLTLKGTGWGITEIINMLNNKCNVPQLSHSSPACLPALMSLQERSPQRIWGRWSSETQYDNRACPSGFYHAYDTSHHIITTNLAYISGSREWPLTLKFLHVEGARSQPFWIHFCFSG